MASLCSDLCIHGHLYAGTAALESASTGVPTILIDTEGYPENKLHELEKNKVIFYSWPEVIEAINENINCLNYDSNFGNWSNILSKVDLFGDNNGASRLGSYLYSLMKEYEQGNSKTQAMANAAEIYMKKWGANTVIYDDRTKTILDK